MNSEITLSYVEDTPKYKVFCSKPLVLIYKNFFDEVVFSFCVKYREESANGSEEFFVPFTQNANLIITDRGWIYKYKFYPFTIISVKEL